MPRGRARCTLDGVVLVRRDLPVHHTTERYGLPVTTRTVTALDLMSRLPLTQGLPFADRALQQGWVTRDAAQRRLGSSHRGNPRLREVMRLVGPGQAESQAERRAQRILRKAGLTGWVAADRTRQNLLVSRGWTVLRYTWQDVTERPHTLVDDVARFVAAG